MTKRLLGAIAALVVAGFFLTGTAQADCWWNGYNWNCNYYAPNYNSYYGSYPYGWQQSYPSYDYNYYYGYRYPGPKASGGGSYGYGY